MAGFFGRFLDPDVDARLLVDEGEFIVDEVHHHWIVFLVPVAAVLAGVALFLVMPWWGKGFWLAMVLGLVACGWGLARCHIEHMDRFVVTNMRVFRVHGVLSQTTATMPMTRILDISVTQPLLGRLLDYGHLVFESAAQDQGLRDIRFVARPRERDLTIQRVIQRAGLRKTFGR